MKLSAEELSFFSDNGYVVKRQVVSPETIDTIRRSSDALIDSDECIFRMTDGEFDGYRNLLYLDSSFLDLVELEATLVPVVQILGSNIHLSSAHLSYIYPKPADKTWQGDWHTDIYGFENDLQEQIVRVGIKCAFPLTNHTSADTGMTIMIPGSHKDVRPTAIDLHDPHPPGAMQLNLGPGDCVLFENRIRHSRGLNLGPDTRKCILIGYSFRWVMPLDSLDGHELPHNEISELARDLLPRAYGVNGNSAIEGLCRKHGLPLRPAKIL